MVKVKRQFPPIRPPQQRKQPIILPQPRSNDFWSVWGEAGRSMDLMDRDAQNLI